MKKHLAIFSAGVGEMILSGQKIVETRFSKAKIVPYGVVSSGDLIYIKPVGKDIIGQFLVKKVIYYDGLSKEMGEIEEIRERYGEEIAADEGFWQAHKDSKYATLIFIGQSSGFLTSPIKISKKDQRGWVVLD